MSIRETELSQSEIEERVVEFRKWIRTEPDLPQNIETKLLLRYLKTYGFKVDKAQKLLKYSISLRVKNKDIFTNRDVLSPEIQNVFDHCEMVPMLKATPENFKCCIFRLIETKTEKFNFNDTIKAFFMFADLRLVSPDPNPDQLADGEVPIFDMQGLSVWHLFKLSLSTLRLYFKYTQEAHPVRVQQIHVCNCTSLINRVMSLIKPLLKADVASRFLFHSAGSETIFKFIPREILPEEYGGEAGPIKMIKEHWMQLLLERREYIMNDANWIVTSKEDLNNNDTDYFK